MISIFSPRYAHRPVSQDEKFGRAIAEMLDPETPLPQKCGECGAASSIRNPLLMKPFFRMEHGGPRGTLYQARCSECQEKRVRRRSA